MAAIMGSGFPPQEVSPMRRTSSLLLLGVLLVFVSIPAWSAVLSTGVDTSRPAPALKNHTAGPGCPVLWYAAGDNGEPARYSALGFPVTFTNNPADLNPVNLANYSVLVVAFTGPGVLGPEQPAIEGFVLSGRGLLIHQPNAVGLIDYAPTGFFVNTADLFWCNFPNPPPPTIVNGAHPLTVGLTDADLSGAFDLVSAIGPGYTLLARSIPCGDPALAAGTLGGGRVVYEDGNGGPGSLQPGTDPYWANIFFWLCTGYPVPTHRDTWGRIKAAYR
jgi:hypothetical protein